ncbi:MAG: zinc-binding dehydrogenase, partial [candidate division NC10 bacterium]
DIVHAVIGNSQVQPGQRVAVLGPGTMGLLTAQLARAIGEGQVIVVGLAEDQQRMEIALRIGADYTINITKENLVERVMELTDGHGADIVFEVSGSDAAFVAGLKIMAKRGQMTIIGVPKQPVEIDLLALQAAEQTIRSSIMSTWSDYEQAIQLAKTGRLKLKPLITDVLPIIEWKKGFDLALAKKACKVVFTPVG